MTLVSKIQQSVRHKIMTTPNHPPQRISLSTSRRPTTLTSTSLHQSRSNSNSNSQKAQNNKDPLTMSRIGLSIDDCSDSGCSSDLSVSVSDGSSIYWGAIDNDDNDKNNKNNHDKNNNNNADADDDDNDFQVREIAVSLDTELLRRDKQQPSHLRQGLAPTPLTSQSLPILESDYSSMVLQRQDHEQCPPSFNSQVRRRVEDVEQASVTTMTEDDDGLEQFNIGARGARRHHHLWLRSGQRLHPRRRTFGVVRMLLTFCALSVVAVTFKQSHVTQPRPPMYTEFAPREEVAFPFHQKQQGQEEQDTAEGQKQKLRASLPKYYFPQIDVIQEGHVKKANVEGINAGKQDKKQPAGGDSSAGSTTATRHVKRQPNLALAVGHMNRPVFGQYDEQRQQQHQAPSSQEQQQQVVRRFVMDKNLSPPSYSHETGTSTSTSWTYWIAVCALLYLTAETGIKEYRRYRFSSGRSSAIDEQHRRL